MKSFILGVKLVDQIHVPGSGLLYILAEVVESIGSIVQDLRYGKRPLPWGRQLVGLLLIHSEDEITFLKGRPSDVSIVIVTQILLIHN